MSESSASTEIPSGGEEKLDLRSMNLEEVEALVERLGERKFRGKQILRWLHARAVKSFEEMTDLSKLFRARLAEVAELRTLSLAKVERARDGTRKYAFRTTRGDLVEAVFIPDASADGRNTLCISSQVGCGLDCKFCLTASLGLIRNLSAGEILEQLSRVKEDLIAHPLPPSIDLEPDPAFRDDEEDLGPEPPRVSNVVMMGMGEPLQNYDALLRALQLMNSEEGHGMSLRRITVSTVGLAPRIPKLGQDLKVNLAVSLNATTDEVRDRIMPINKRYNIETLLAACRAFPLPERRRITFEYVLLEGVNDSPDDARRLVRLLRGIRAKVNLIPYNEHPYSPFKRPSREVVARFQAILGEGGLAAFIRTPRGDDISAACGQLGAEVEAPRRIAVLPVLP